MTSMAVGKIYDNALLLAILYVLIGITMVTCGNGSISFIFWLTGTIYILIGIDQIVTKSVDAKGGLITIVIGFVVILLGRFIGILIVGMILVLSSLPALIGVTSGIADKFGMGRIDTGHALVNKIVTVILLIVGICLIMFFGLSDSFEDPLVRIGGAVLLLVGSFDLVRALKS